MPNQATQNNDVIAHLPMASNLFSFDRAEEECPRGVCAPGKPWNSGDFERRYLEIPGIVVQKKYNGRGVAKWYWVSDHGLPCHEFEPNTTKDLLCRAAMRIKSVES
ncbi:hypothetical protein TNCV_4928191 [Trichonephila clavipes]|nr:hypothetical protein TNCV_4928191 [Trichonephila clavipes]